MVKRILDKLIELRDNALQAAVKRKPDGSQSEAYLLGFLQGKHAGLQEALDAFTAWADDEEEQQDNL